MSVSPPEDIFIHYKRIIMKDQFFFSQSFIYYTSKNGINVWGMMSFNSIKISKHEDFVF